MIGIQLDARESVFIKTLFPPQSVKSLENHHFSRVIKYGLEPLAKCVSPPLLVWFIKW